MFMDSGERPFNSMDSDLISKLPSNIVDNILICLPLKYAVRTSILSREWRFKWRYIPELVLAGDGFYGRSCNSPREYWLQIYQILSLHRGPLNKFLAYLNYVEAKDISLLDQLILFLCEKDVRKLNLCCYSIETGHRDHRNILPSTLFQCLQLTHLCLEYYTLRLPPQFIGFSRLVIVRLYWIKISADDFKIFISKCPVLRELALQELVVDDNILEIDAPNLEVLHIYDFDGPILLKNVPVLSKFRIEGRPGVVGSMPNIVNPSRSLPAVEKFSVTQDSLTFIGFSRLIIVTLYWIEISADDFKTFISKCPVLRELTLQAPVVDGNNLEIDAPNLEFLKICYFDGSILLKNVPVLSKLTVQSSLRRAMPNIVSPSPSLPAVEKFSVTQDSLTDLSGGVIPQSMFNHLKFIELSGLSFNTPKQIKCALLLISSSPNLAKLKIKSRVEAVDIRHQEASSLVGGDSFSVQEVELEKFNGTVAELEFLEIILAKSLVLKKITIRPPEDISDKEEVIRILKAINQMERGSPKAKVMFIDRLSRVHMYFRGHPIK